MSQRLVLVSVMALTIIGAVADATDPAWSQDDRNGDIEPLPDDSNSGILDGLFSGIGDFIAGISGFLNSLTPPLTGVEFFDEIIQNAFAAFLGYKTIVFARGGGG